MVIRMIILLGFSMLFASSPLVAEPAPSMLSDQGQHLLMGPIEWAAGAGETPASKELVARSSVVFQGRVTRAYIGWNKRFANENFCRFSRIDATVTHASAKDFQTV